MSPRPKLIKRISGIPASSGFVPLHGENAEPVVLLFEEYESVLLCDYEGLTQAEAARQMKVSRPTVTRIYASARKKIAEALVCSRSLVVEGGRVYTDLGWFSCLRCDLLFNTLSVQSRTDGGTCPRCGDPCREIDSENINLKKYRTMKKIALPTRGGQIDDHFGHCEFYTLVSVDEAGQIVLTETMPSPQGCGCKSHIAEELQEKGVTVMLAGNMGAGALNKLSACGIQVFRGCHGAVLQVVEAYLRGEIQDSGVSCQHHDEAGHSCGHH